MGGSGGGYFRSDPEKIKKKLRDSESHTEDARYEADVAAFLSSLLTKFNSRDNEAINRHLTQIKNALDKEIEGTVDLLFGGSVAKQTYIDGLSDIDTLVILDKAELANENPATVYKYLIQRLKERFPSTEIKAGTLAVTLCFADSEIQILPVVRSGQNLKIADQSGQNWTQIKPKAFSEKLSQTNQQVGRKIVPVIKLAKAIIANLPQKHQITGYHAESLAVKIFKDIPVN